MSNNRTRTIWSINGRAPDSRDVKDYTGQGLRVGRIDIPASETVTIEGYSKVEYRITMGDGSVKVYPDFSTVISSMNGVIESKVGSKIMTVFLNDTGKNSLGFYRIDVYKEWTDKDPEPELGESEAITKLMRYGTEYGFGIYYVDAKGTARMIEWQGNDIDAAVKDTATIADLVKRIKALESAAATPKD